MTVLQKKKVVVAMSGGVDSSVAALLLKEQGLEVIGVSMKTHDSLALATPQGGYFVEPDARLSQGEDTALPLDNPSSGKVPRTKTCCAARDIQDARRVCQKLDIPFYPMNFKEEFRKGVMEYFVSEYGQGRTPNPCVLCNDRLKFSTLLQKIRQLGAYYLATGHYVQKSRDVNGRYHLLKGRDRDKDQSYFLYGLDQQQLEHLLFPVGRYTKADVRELARSAGLEVADKEESQEICFVTTGHYADFIESSYPKCKGSPGLIVDREGKILGKHEGIHVFTIGQRRGIGVAAKEKLYVTELQPKENKVVVGPQEDLMKKGIVVKAARWVHRDQIRTGMEVETQIRYRHPATPSRLSRIEGGTVHVDFSHPDGAITPGQAAVFYQGEELLGGGWIEEGIE